MSHYVTTAQMLRLLGSDDSTFFDGCAEPLRSIFRLGAEACEQVDAANHRQAQALLRIAELERLLARAADALEATPMPIEGGSWTVFELATEIRRALGEIGPGP